jgi:Zn-dependent protease with chaperone function
MDFFTQQDRAKSKTSVLIVYFSISVLLTILAIYGATAFFLTHFSGNGRPSDGLALFTDGLPWFDLELFLLVFGSVSLLIAIGSSVMMFRLSQGGKSVATLLGGRPLNPSTTQRDEIKLRNVVEEMSLASGLPMPELYLLDQEDGINAFAAGYTSSDAVVGVTKGCLQTLTRDELQGVIAHEFSHILNGDMRLNMRLACLTHGILFISETGKWIFQAAGRTVTSGSRGGKKDGLPIILVVMLAGGILTLIGSIGYFFSSALKAAISRQREFLADASAVQFTRNPSGISGVLKKIGGFKAGSALKAPEAGQASHFFFSQGVNFFLGNLLSTHPPLAERIRAIDPTFNYEFPKLAATFQAEDTADTTAKSLSSEFAPVSPSRASLVKPEQVINSVGKMDPTQLQLGQLLRAKIPEALFAAAHEPYSAQALLFAALVVDSDKEKTESSILTLAGENLSLETLKLIPAFQALPHSLRLPLIDLSLPALKLLSPAQYQKFRQTIQTLVEADLSISLFEYTLQKILIRHLDSHFSPARKPEVKFSSLNSILEPTRILLASLAYFDSSDPNIIDKVFKEGCKQLNTTEVSHDLPAQEACGLAQFDQSLNVLQYAVPSIKKNILYACATIVMFDSQITEQEEDLLRAIATTLDCPIPPFALRTQS